MSRPGLTDYEKYIRTDELLALQKPAAELSCHDELQFQIVHQAAELWMKLVDHEIGFVARELEADRVPRAMRGLDRVRRVQTVSSCSSRCSTPWRRAIT